MLTAEQLTAIAAAAEAALAEIAKAHNVSITCTRDEGATFRYTVTPLNAADQEAWVTRFDLRAFLVGLPKGLYRRTILDRGRRYTVVEIVPRRGKYPVTMERDDGKLFKFPAEFVLRQLTATEE